MEFNEYGQVWIEGRLCNLLRQPHIGPFLESGQLVYRSVARDYAGREYQVIWPIKGEFDESRVDWAIYKLVRI